MISLALLGSTGSIGRSTVEVLRRFPDRLRVVTLAAHGSDLDALEAQAREFAPSLVAVHDEESAGQLAGRLPGVKVVAGPEGVIEAAVHPQVDRVVAAMVGAAGLAPAYAAAEAGKDLALANKEALVVGGEVLKRAARESGAAIVPIDSEHVALHQALRCGEASEVRGTDPDRIGGAVSCPPGGGTGATSLPTRRWRIRPGRWGARSRSIRRR